MLGSSLNAEVGLCKRMSIPITFSVEKKTFFYFDKSCKMCNIHLNAEHGNKIEKMLVDYTCTSYAYQSLAP